MPDETHNRPLPFTADAAGTVRDASGNPLATFSSPGIAAEMVDLYNARHGHEVNCDLCQSLTVRDGDCRRCINCGNTFAI